MELRQSVLIVSLVFPLIACASHFTGDRDFEAGRYAAAASAYETALTSRKLTTNEEIRVRYQLAMIHSLPDSPLYDPDKAATFFRELVWRYPNSPYAKQAEIILEFQGLLTSLRDEVSARQLRVSLLLQELADLKSGMEELQGEVGSKSARIDVLSAQVASLKRQVQQLSEEVSKRERELQRLKEIDLAGPPN